MVQVNQGVVPPDFSTAVGKVRLLIQDTNPTETSNGRGTFLWQSDEEIEALLELKGSPERVAIFILRQVAMTPAMQLKKWSSADLSVDGPAITRALRDLIRDLEDSLDDEDAVGVSEFAMIVPTGASVAQPALLPKAIEIGGVPLDPTLPSRLL